MRHINIVAVLLLRRNFGPDQIMAGLVYIIVRRSAELDEFKLDGHLAFELEPDQGMPLVLGVVRPIIDILILVGQTRSDLSRLDSLTSRRCPVERNPFGSRNDFSRPRRPRISGHEQHGSALLIGMHGLGRVPLHRVGAPASLIVGILTAPRKGDSYQHHRRKGSGKHPRTIFIYQRHSIKN